MTSTEHIRYKYKIDHYSNFASIISLSKNVLTLQIASFMYFDSTVVFGMKVTYVFGIF